MSAGSAEQVAALVADAPRRLPVNGWYQGWFILLLLCWAVLMAWPCLADESLMVSRADNAVMTLMAGVILTAVRMALLAREKAHIALFSGAELLYCGAY